MGRFISKAPQSKLISFYDYIKEKTIPDFYH